MPNIYEDRIVPPQYTRGGRLKTNQPLGPVGRFFGAAGRFVFEVAKVVLVALVIIIPIRIFIFQPFQVNGESMNPNFLDRDYLIVDEITYRFKEPQRGEVIVFKYPKDPKQYFIKRIIGLPGETVIIKNGEVIIKDHDNQELDETAYLTEDFSISDTINQEIVLGADEYFVLGDNRDASSDSRTWGPITRSDIIGRAWYRAFPFDRAQSIPIPTY